MHYVAKGWCVQGFCVSSHREETSKTNEVSCHDQNSLHDTSWYIRCIRICTCIITSLCRCMAVTQHKNYRIMLKTLQLSYEVPVRKKWLSQVKIIFKHITLQNGAEWEVSDMSIWLRNSEHFININFTFSRRYEKNFKASWREIW